jgi:hypothetical protein
MEYMDYNEIIETIAKAGARQEIVKIYYPKTDKTNAGWREVEPYSFTTDIGEEGEHLIYGKDRLSPGHIFNGFTLKNYIRNSHCQSFIIGKIKAAKLTKIKFTPRNNWKVEF